MAIQRRWKLLACAITLSGLVLGGVFVYDQLNTQRPGGNSMNETRIMVDHVHMAINKPFEEVTKAFEAQLGKFDGDVLKAALAATLDRKLEDLVAAAVE